MESKKEFMECFLLEDSTKTPETTADASGREDCGRCATKGSPVSRKTVLLMLKSQLLEQASTGKYRFCATRDCSIVYFEEDGNRFFTQDDLRVRVGVKSSSDPIPLCYCFGFDESHLRDEISQTRSTSIPERVSRLIREGLCACDTRNPSGNCCLGEVNKAAKRIKEEVLDSRLNSRV